MPKGELTSKRVKVTLACTICRKKKVKCDGIQPTCSRCISIGNCCQYSDPPKKRGPPKGFVEVIENRAHRIESLLGKEHSVTNTDESNVLCDRNIEDIPHNTHLQPSNALFSVITSAVYSMKSNSHQPYLYGSNGTLLRHSNNMNEASHYLWIENYFNYFNLVFPVLSRPQFTLELMSHTVDPLLKLAVFILGHHFTHRSRENDSLLHEFESTLNMSRHSPMLSTVQALIIMTWYTYLTGDMHHCHLMRIGLIQTIQQLNLGYENKEDIHTSEMRRRAFWICYTMDQWIATSNSSVRLLCNYQDKKWNSQWPKLEDDELFGLHNPHEISHKREYSSSDHLLQVTSFNEMIKLTKILGCIYDYSITTHTLESNLTEWLLHLPPYLDYGKMTENTPIAKIYRILYHTVRITLNKRIPLNQANHSLSLCTTSANIIIHIAEQMLDIHQNMYLSNVFLFSLTLATSMHLDATIMNGEHNIPDRISLHKSVSIIKDINCTLLSTVQFDQLMDRFLIDRCQLELDFIIPTPRRMRRCETHEDALLNTNMHEYIMNDLFSLDPLDQPLSWFNLLDYTEASTTTCSPISQPSPSQSPSQSMSYHSLKEEETYALLTDSIFVNTFP